MFFSFIIIFIVSEAPAPDPGDEKEYLLFFEYVFGGERGRVSL